GTTSRATTAALLAVLSDKALRDSWGGRPRPRRIPWSGGCNSTNPAVLNTVLLAERAKADYAEFRSIIRPSISGRAESGAAPRRSRLLFNLDGFLNLVKTSTVSCEPLPGKHPLLKII